MCVYVSMCLCVYVCLSVCQVHHLHLVTHVKGCMISSPNLSFVPLWQEPCGLPALDFRSHLWFFSAYPSAPMTAAMWPSLTGVMTLPHDFLENQCVSRP